jgi:hypothetical protein
LRFYEFVFVHQLWSTFGDADKIAPLNPLRRVRRWCLTAAKN